MRRATAGEILPFVQRAARYETAPGIDCQAIAQNGAAFIVRQGGRDVFGYTLEPINGGVLITSAAGSAAADLTRAGLAMIERQAAGAAWVEFETIRPGLVKKARRLGYVVQSVSDAVPAVYRLRKGLHEHH